MNRAYEKGLRMVWEYKEMKIRRKTFHGRFSWLLSLRRWIWQLRKLREIFLLMKMLINRGKLEDEHFENKTTFF